MKSNGSFWSNTMGVHNLTIYHYAEINIASERVKFEPHLSIKTKNNFNENTNGSINII